MGNLSDSPEAAAYRDLLKKLLEFHDTDAGNAESFELLHGEEFRHDCTHGKWLMWDGNYWETDETGQAERAALDTVRKRFQAVATMGISANEEGRKVKEARTRWALSSESLYHRRALLNSAESIKSLATKTTDYDRDAFLLTVGNGTLDLRTGELREAQPADLITRATDVDYVPGAKCPRWLRFLDEIFDGDNQVIEFVWRAVGYTLTGSTQEQCLFILYGDGANGKSTFLEILIGLLGTHAEVTPFSTFLIHHNPGNPRNDLAKLHGARLVKAAESPRQAVLDEALVKEATGDDSMSARFLFKELFVFKSQMKIWMATNHKPRISGTDDAIWRRMRLIPFMHKFAGRSRDLRLADKLRGEFSGILAWAVQGCLEWQRSGLGVAPAVEAATLGYRRESDQIGRFLKEWCTTGAKDRTSGNELYQTYLEWCTINKEKPVAINAFAKSLSDRGIQKKRGSQGTTYRGIGLVPEAARAKLVQQPRGGDPHV